MTRHQFGNICAITCALVILALCVMLLCHPEWLPCLP